MILLGFNSVYEIIPSIDFLEGDILRQLRRISAEGDGHGLEAVNLWD